MRTITVKGVGAVAVKPDLIVINVQMSVSHKQYGQAVETCAERVNGLKTVFSRTGFTDAPLKTLDYSVSPEYEWVRDAEGHNQYQRVKGYVCNHSLKMEFDYDLSRMRNAVETLASCAGNPVFNIQFTVKDKGAVSEALLASAIDNAKQKAAILTRAAGVSLGKIQTIDYDWGEIRFLSETRYNPPTCAEYADCKSIQALDIEPDDIHANDTVTVIWEIE